MPELPEVESVRIGLADGLIGQSLGRPEQLHPRALNPRSIAPLAALTGLEVTAVRRRGKFLWVETDSDICLVAHLGMSGQFRFQPRKSATENHLRARIPIKKNPLELRFIDQRTFGWLARYRRLTRNYKHTVLSSETKTYIASVRPMLKLVAI